MAAPIFTVDDRQVLAHIDALPQELREHLVAHLGPVDDRMLALVRAAAPDRTGRLRNQIRGAVVSTETSVVAKVFVAGRSPQDFAKAAALEWGVPGLSRRAARRAPGGLVSVKASRRAGESVIAYHRRVRIEARRYLRRALVTMQTMGVEAIQAAIDETVVEF